MGTNTYTGTDIGTHAHGISHSGVGNGKNNTNKVSSATKGARYDVTGGEVDDRTAMQKMADKLSPGSAVGKHTRYATAVCGASPLCHVTMQFKLHK